MTPTTTTSQAEAYLEAVRQNLADLSEEERSDLLEDLAQHLADVANEPRDSEGSLRDRLGDPATYADELRGAAGLPRSRGAVEPPLHRTSIRELIGRGWRGAGELVRDLRPAWWVVRGVVAVCALFWLGPNADDNFPVPQPAGSHALGLVVVLTGVALSVWLGRSSDQPSWRRGAAVGNIALFVGLALGSFAANPTVESFQTIESQPVLVSRHGPVTNIYPYDSEGRPLEGVLLFDQDGRPLRTGTQERWADGCRRQIQHPLAGAYGVPIEFSYPHHYAALVAPAIVGPGDTFSDRCPEIPRPSVPIPTFAPAAPGSPVP